MMMNQFIVVCAVLVGAMLTLDAAYVPELASKDTSHGNQQELINDIRSMYMERYSPG